MAVWAAHWSRRSVRARIDRGQGHSLIADAQQRADNYAADAQCDDRAGGKIVAVHSHISLPRSRSVIV